MKFGGGKNRGTCSVAQKVRPAGSRRSAGSFNTAYTVEEGVLVIKEQADAFSNGGEIGELKALHHRI